MDVFANALTVFARTRAAVKPPAFMLLSFINLTISMIEALREENIARGSVSSYILIRLSGSRIDGLKCTNSSYECLIHCVVVTSINTVDNLPVM